MKIVVLDGYTLNPGDLSWDALSQLGACVVHDRTGAEDVVGRAAGAEIVLTNKTVITSAHLEQLTELRYIGVLATGTNVVDLAAAGRRGIVVTNVPAYSTPSVAQTTIALLLELTHHVGNHVRTVQAGRWTSSPDFCYWDFPLIELAGLTMGLVGFGRIASAVSNIAAAMGMKIIACTRTPRTLPDFVEPADLESVFRRSDVLSLHCPLTDETRHLVNTERLSWMKPAAFLLNTGRGPLIDEPALANALNEGRLAGAGLDVLSSEPPAANNPLLTAKNCLITPHFAWASGAARVRLMQVAVENVRSFLAGTARNVVS